MNKLSEKVLSFSLRNGILYLLLGLIYYFLVPGTAEIKTVMFIVSIEVLAILLSGLAVYTYTNINFFRYLNEGDDGKLNSVERHAVLEVIAKIFLGVHILVGLSIVGIYAIIPN